MDVNPTRAHGLIWIECDACRHSTDGSDYGRKWRSRKAAIEIETRKWDQQQELF